MPDRRNSQKTDDEVKAWVESQPSPELSPDQIQRLSAILLPALEALQRDEGKPETLRSRRPSPPNPRGQQRDPGTASR